MVGFNGFTGSGLRAASEEMPGSLYYIIRRSCGTRSPRGSPRWQSWPCRRQPRAAVRGGLFRQYEYEEEVYLSLDGTATVYVHASLAALNALRGTSFATAPNAPLDRDGGAGVLHDAGDARRRQVNASRRSNRRFVHVQLDVDDIRRLGEAAPFAWSTYDSQT